LNQIIKTEWVIVMAAANKIYVSMFSYDFSLPSCGGKFNGHSLQKNWGIATQW
jgi:hypothetical protein